MSSDSVQPSSKSNLAGKCVLITRPQALSSYLVSEIEKRGAHPITLPTIETVSVAKSSKIGEFLCEEPSATMVVFVSRNAVHAVEEFIQSNNIPWPAHFSCAAVGPKTALEIRQAFNVRDVLEPASNFGIEGLLQTSQFDDLRSIPTAIVDGGGDNSVILRDALIARGSPKVSHFVVYRRQMPTVDCAEARRRIKNDSMHYVIVSSVEGASNMLKILSDVQDNTLVRLRIIAYSERIGDFLRQRGFSSVAVANEPSDNSVIQTMERLSV